MIGILKKLKTEYPTLTVREIDAISNEAQDLIKEHAESSSPCLLINGEYMSMGDATEHVLRKKFDEILAVGK
ncbi:hypothetical protein M1446_03845 [Candidatus Dependentiae bacterium]|nr:hypothetical protein [Candidatus Dependentiae bacterium]